MAATPEAIEDVCIEKGVAENLPNAVITFDKFHAVKIVNDAVDQVRRAEQKGQHLLRGTRYLRLRNPAHLSDRQRATPDSLPTRHLKTARDGILRWFNSKIANGLMEGVNSLIQAAKAKARGYR